MTRPVVALSQRRDPTGPPHNEVRDALDHRLAAFVIAAGGLPFPVPSVLADDALADWLTACGPDAVLLSGGADIGLNADRDRIDMALLDHARGAGLPVLGICRGLQVMAHVAGTALVPVEGHVAKPHDVTGDITRRVNSYHAQALAGVPDGYRALAHAPDGTIEAIAHDSLPWEGWMWHPERDARFDPEDISRFRKLIA